MLVFLLGKWGGAGAIAVLLLAGCTTKIAEIKPNQPVTGEMRSVYGYACDYFTWPYGSADDLKQQALQQAQSQANNWAQAAHSEATADAIAANGYRRGVRVAKQEWELVNTVVKKEIWPWFYGLLGMKCVKVQGSARPKAD
ncbi:hypothetical protein HAL013_00280 [Helicobacter ailurogastricus]|uniref:Uncharacterized protein n=1 Tax=Helicobacter ailurogastricus TaxID=1578720 RepID=A0A0K2X5X5_9HELI|nr:hypothetical protein HAL013_00280 [Helicobacter ailurogastricus]